MYVALIVLHVLVSFAIIGIVLLQSGKGADIGSAFGGAGSQAVFGSMGTPTIMGKITTGVAIVFTVTSFTLAILGGGRGTRLDPLTRTRSKPAVPIGLAATSASTLHDARSTPRTAPPAARTIASVSTEKTTAPAPNPRARKVAISRVREATAVYIVLMAPKTAPMPISTAMKYPSVRMSRLSCCDCCA